MTEEFFEIESDVAVEEEREVTPIYGSQEWHDYIMSKFEKEN